MSILQAWGQWPFLIAVNAFISFQPMLQKMWLKVAIDSLTLGNKNKAYIFPNLTSISGIIICRF